VKPNGILLTTREYHSPLIIIQELSVVVAQEASEQEETLLSQNKEMFLTGPQVAAEAEVVEEQEEIQIMEHLKQIHLMLVILA